MPIVPFDQTFIPAIERFNERMQSGGSEHSFPSGAHVHAWYGNTATTAVDAELHVIDGAGFISWERYLYVQGDEVRGAYMLIRQRAIVNGMPAEAQFLKFPLSEGIVDPKFGLVGVALVKDALRRAPHLFGLGMGALDNPLPRLLEKLGATLHPVPFYFRVLNASRFLRNFRSLRRSAARARMLDVAATLKLGSIPLAALNTWQSRHRPSTAHLRAEVVSAFGSWADELWQRSAPRMSFACFRGAGESNDRFPLADARFIRLVVREGQQVVGWSVLTNSQFDDHKYFGGMRLGAIADSMAMPGFEPAVAWLSLQHLQQLAVDLVVTNQWHAAWRDAFTRSGFRQGPTNFIFAPSPALQQAITAGDSSLAGLHLTRGDGDGPINL